MKAEISLDASDFDRVMAAAKAFPGDAEQAINNVMHNEAGPLVYKRINPLIHPSGRTFKGHSASATASAWPMYDTGENLAVTVKARSRYGYLYFPDDGSNTKRHAGQQHFFRRGAEAATTEIVDRCLTALTREWSE